MGHTCPDCGQACYCGADIDDCMNEFFVDVVNCDHWRICQQEPEIEDE